MYLTPAQVSEKLHISEGSVRRLIETGQLPSLPTNGSKKFYRIDEAAVKAFKKAAPASIAAPKAPSTNGHVPEGFLLLGEATKKYGYASGGSLSGRIKRGAVELIKVNGRRYVRESDVAATRPHILNRVAVPVVSPTVGIAARLKAIEHDIADLKAKMTSLLAELGGL